MTFKEFAVIIATLENSYKSQPATKETMKIWYECLKDIDYKIAHKAIQKILLTSKFYPTIAEIRESCYELLNGEKMTGGEAWGIFTKYITLSSPRSDYEKLENDYPEVYKIVKHLGGRDLLLGNISFVRPEFERIFNENYEISKKQNLLTDSFKKEIEILRGQIYNQLRISGE
ncbi:MAG: replicative helicase loader/inhibitor [Candidatus Odinarchaeota archaeon]